MHMTGATICSGIGAPEAAMPEIDWLWAAEIDKFATAVHAERHGVPNLGDVTAADFVERALAIGRPDVLVAGTPCQAFSVAGLRRSLADDRGNITLRFVEIIDAIRPRFVVWENVPGVLNTGDNAFGCFLGALVGEDSAIVLPRGQRWTDCGVVAGPARTAAWRILDAQYFGLAQRRERVFVVASAGDGPHPAEILFESKGVQRHSAPSRETGKGVAGTLEGRAGRSGANNFATSGGLIDQTDRQTDRQTDNGSTLRSGQQDRWEPICERGLSDSVAKTLRAKANASHRADSDTYIAEHR
jgi:DNA (cytosine-5)-methyltransferase 1